MRITSLFLLLFFHFYSFSQVKEIDFLSNNYSFFDVIKSNLENYKNNEKAIEFLDSVLQKQKDNYVINRIELFKANLYRNIDIKNTYAILKRVEKYLNDKPNLTHLKTHYDIVLARALYDSGKNKESLAIYERASSQKFEFEDSENIWNYNFEIKTGIISNNIYLGKEKIALKLLIDLQQDLDPKSNMEEYVYTLNLIGYLHTKSKNYKDGTTYFNEIISLLKNKENYKEAYFSAVNNLGYIYQTETQTSKATKLIEEALIQSKKYNLINKEILFSINLGFLYLKNNELNKAENQGLYALERSTAKFNALEADSHRLLAASYYKKADYKKSITHADKSILYFKEINDLNRLKYTLKIKNKALIATKNFEEATIVNSEMISIMDSIALKNDMQNLQKTLVAFETEKKDNQITILKQKEELAAVNLSKQRAQIIFLIALLLMLLTFGSIVFFYQKKFNYIKNTMLQAKLIRSQFNPHYINNAFTTLQAELVEHNFNENLIDFTSNISRFSRLILESTFKDEWTLKEEKNMIEYYLNIQRHRLHNNFNYTIKNLLNKEDLLAIKLPSAITQTALENAIEHSGISDTKKPVDIKITFQKDSSFLFICIKNSVLVTEKKGTTNTEKSPSRGLKITKERMQLYGSINKKETHFTLIKNNDAVEAIFQFPIIAA